MSPIGIAHVFFGVLALILGGIVVFQPKGNQRHRKLGYAYVFSMLMLNGLSFLMYRSTGHFGHLGPFHILSFISLFTLLNGWMVVYFKRPAHNWLQVHIAWMGWSYVGLWAATATEVVVRLPFVRTPGLGIAAIVLTTLVVTVLGGGLLFGYFRRAQLTFSPPAPEQSKIP